MRTSTCCASSSTNTRCRTPLIEICDSVNQIKLNLGACGVCAITPVALLLEKTGCPEYEIVCAQPERTTCCGVIANYPEDYYIRKVREIPRPSVMYLLHEVDAEGLSVFTIDSKLKTLGYGRLTATVMLLDDAVGTFDQPRYKRTNVVFDIDYIAYRAALNSITVTTDKHIGEEC